MDVRLPDGTVIQGVPDGTTKADLAAKLKSNGMAVPAEWLAAAPAPQQQSVGDVLRDVPRQVGLTARYGLEGLGRVADIATEPIRNLIVNPLMRAVGGTEVRSSTSGQAAGLADAIGLPTPQTPTERIVGEAARTVAGAGGTAGLAGQGAKLASGVTRNVLEQMAARPAVQVAGATGAGLAGGSVKEAGGGPWEQFGASLLGGLAAGGAAAKVGDMAGSATNALKNLVTPKAVQLERADQQINLTLKQEGVDWSQVPERIRQGMREDVAQAMNTGQSLNADALRRLLVFRKADVTPTVGQLTQDPTQITQEMNLAKVGANSTDPTLQRLPGLQNKNTAKLLQQLDDAGAATAQNAPDTARQAIGSLASTASKSQANIDSLYQQARDSSGRSVVLDGPAASQAAVVKLAKDGVGKLPPEVDGWLNDITSGKTPLTVDYQQQLVKNLYRKIQGTQDGDLRHGLGIVRQALDEADVLPTAQVNPGNLPAVPGTVPPSTAQAGQEAIDAFKTARGANRAWMAKVEANPALKAVVDGVEPDQFVQKFVVGNGASGADVKALKSELSPEAVDAMKQFLIKHLKDAATNGTDDIVKFSGAAYRKELGKLGEKLPAFFTKDEIEHLTNIGDAAKYMQAQPAGAAVNNSNSGALVIGKGLDMLASASKLPLNAAKAVLSGTIQGYQQRQALAPSNALTQLAGLRPAMPVNPLLAATIAGPANAGQDDRRR